MQEQTELIGLGRMAGGAIGGEVVELTRFGGRFVT
jgi:hypothetical protein